jgi:tetratricopeptide (TPR) repeat protein
LVSHFSFNSLDLEEYEYIKLKKSNELIEIHSNNLLLEFDDDFDFTKLVFKNSGNIFVDFSNFKVPPLEISRENYQIIQYQSDDYKSWKKHLIDLSEVYEKNLETGQYQTALLSNDADNLYLVGIDLYESKNFDEAFRFFQRASQCQPPSISALGYLSKFYEFGLSVCKCKRKHLSLEKKIMNLKDKFSL